MINTIATRIQSRLSRKGVKVVLGDIKKVLNQMVANVENITDLEVNAVTEHFINIATQLTVVDEDIATEQIEAEEIFSSVDVDIVNSIDSAMNTVSIQDIGDSDLHTNEADLDTENKTAIPSVSAAIAPTTKSELVASTAGELGIVLDAQEISLIAENITDSTDTLEQDIDAIESAIIAFVEHKAAISQQKINNMITSVRNVVTEKNSENSQLLTDGLRSINSDIQEANKDFKSQVKTALTAFKLPSLKAG